MVSQLRVGVHVSITGTLDRAVDRAKEKGCTAFQIFTRNPRGWKFKELDQEEVKEFKRKVEEYGYDEPIAHMPYLPNLASPNDEIYKKTLDTLIAELDRCGRLEIPYLVTHLGSHLGAGMDVGFKRIIDACNRALKRVDNDVMILLENTAGTKNSMGTHFEDIKYILDRIEQRDRVGVCFDTCHAFAAGYDLRDKKAIEQTLNHFDRVIGFKDLKVVHINDSKGDLGSNIDRHEHIGLGYIGEEGFRALLHDERIRKLPLILETPIDDRRGDEDNIKKVRELAK
ncbi:MAG: deoxyribonuclease IV [Nitrososphaerota archaeon]|nr:deoxyribonuclease IV [Nitrososphaerales archaeon]MDW8044603.1 deoxyribonuclease IV [Nitrososphaerota archaeon]